MVPISILREWLKNTRQRPTNNDLILSSKYSFMKRFHGTDYENLLDMAETEVIEASKFSEEEMFTELDVQQNVYNTDEGVWVTDSREAAETYAWGGGYIVIDTSDLKVIDNRDSCYDVIPGDVELEYVDKIFLEENTSGARDFLLELGEKLTEKGYGDIELKEYRGPEFEV